MDPRFPPVEPYDQGLLEVGDGHRIHWEASGRRGGRPAVYLHGGPGAGAGPGARRFFDPAVWDLLAFDQRGCGRSRPFAGEPEADLAANTTRHLVSDLEALRRFRGIERWTVFGLSWGTTLALAYAQRHPERVDALVLGLVTTTSRREVDWITGDVGRIFPEGWEAFTAAIPRRVRHLRPVDAYARLLADPDPAVHEPAAAAWCAWEDVHVSLTPGHRPDPRFDDPRFRLCFARLVTHYWSNSAFLEEDELVRKAGRLDGIPGFLVHGRRDVSGPLETAWRLSKAWRTSRLHVLEDAGHGGGDDFLRAIVAAVDEAARA